MPDRLETGMDDVPGSCIGHPTVRNAPLDASSW
jgi:hypothetical protein